MLSNYLYIYDAAKVRNGVRKRRFCSAKMPFSMKKNFDQPSCIVYIVLAYTHIHMSEMGFSYAGCLQAACRSQSRHVLLLVDFHSAACGIPNGAPKPIYKANLNLRSLDS